MPWKWIAPRLLVVPLALLAACSVSLRQGDRALGESRYVDASAAYARTWAVEEDAALFRQALVHALPESTLYDLKQARATLSELQRRYPKSAYGVAAKYMLARFDRQAALEARLATLDGSLAQTIQAMADATADHERTRQEQLAQYKALEQERDRLTAELKGLRDEHAELVMLRQEHVDIEQLRKENAQLKEELEELKRIDLRR